jgi:RNA recognition motif-containing protein
VGKKLYCGNLSYNTSSSDLEQLFAEYGTVQSAEVIMDRDTGRSKGFGFVEMGSDSEAQAAIDGLNLKEHDGRALAVNEARPREDRRGGGGGGGGSRSGGGGRGGYGGGRRGGY